MGVRRGEPGSGEAGSGLTRVVLNSTVASAEKVSVVWEAVVASAIVAFCCCGQPFCDHRAPGSGMKVRMLLQAPLYRFYRTAWRLKVRRAGEALASYRH